MKRTVNPGPVSFFDPALNRHGFLHRSQPTLNSGLVTKENVNINVAYLGNIVDRRIPSLLSRPLKIQADNTQRERGIKQGITNRRDHAFDFLSQ
jgi:hypothetical protein